MKRIRKRTKIKLAVLLVVLVFPIRIGLKDGGTVIYQSLTYKVIIWHSILDTPENSFKTGTEVLLFPYNFREGY